MPSYIASYSVSVDAWLLAYRPEDNIFGMESDEPSLYQPVPSGPWTAFVSPVSIDQGGGIGLSVKLASGELLELLAHPMPPAAKTDTVYVPFFGRALTLRIEHEDGVLSYSSSEDSIDWTDLGSFAPADAVMEVGAVLRYDTPNRPASGTAGQVRLLDGIWSNVTEEVWVEPVVSARRSTRGAPPQPTVHSTAEPLVHAIIGAQFGDLEFDVGKSVRWLHWYTDNLFVLDVNLGTPRYWIVNWAQTFPDAHHKVTGINYFVLPTEFRKEQWRQYVLEFGDPDDSDWFLFLDAHEGLGLDNRSLPNDYAFEPFKSFLWREIQRAQDNGESSAVLPYYVFLRSDHITNVTYPTMLAQGLEGDVPPVMQALSVPYYLPYHGLRRLWNAKELRKANFDWSILDRVEPASPNAKAQILSYGYAHWNLQDIEPPATTVPPLDADNDDGFRMRKLLSKVRPIPSLPYGDTWVPPEADPVGLPGPWAPADTNNPDPIDPKTGLLMDPPVPPDPSLEGLVIPLYDCVFRLNMRDGVWYEDNKSGNIPLKWDDENQMWITNYDPASWAQVGVKSWDGYYDASLPPDGGDP
jgi:hypothetical protein